jgi:3-carboxy-cis,cis-muconate cycloisomerase
LPSEPNLFASIYARGATAAALSDEAQLQALLDVEAALARACADEGLITAGGADVIAGACVAANFDTEALARATGMHATPVVGLVEALRAAVGEPHARDVHLGATSQDIVDTALMLIAARALEPLLADSRAAADAAASLASAHRDTPMVGRTLLQQALPITFGLRAANWMAGLDAANARLRQIRESELAVQMGGPVGARPPAIGARVAAALELTAPVLPWQAIRVRPAALAAGLGTLAGVSGKIARDVTLLAQQEVGEASEAADPRRGGSSAMAHKHNPVGAVSVLACTKRVPSLVASTFELMEQEHERAAGAWQAEWGVHLELLGLVGSAAAWTRELLETLALHPPRMQANLDRLADSGAGGARLTADQLDACEQLIDRALSERPR